jgi:hypothetical protein
LTWEELGRDLRLAWYWSDHLYVFSLEGCVKNGYLERLTAFTWDQPILLPESRIERIDRFRQSLVSILWFLTHLHLILIGGLGIFAVIFGLRRLSTRSITPRSQK